MSFSNSWLFGCEWPPWILIERSFYELDTGIVRYEISLYIVDTFYSELREFITEIVRLGKISDKTLENFSRYKEKYEDK